MQITDTNARAHRAWRLSVSKRKQAFIHILFSEMETREALKGLLVHRRENPPFKHFPPLILLQAFYTHLSVLRSRHELNSLRRFQRQETWFPESFQKRLPGDNDAKFKTLAREKNPLIPFFSPEFASIQALNWNLWINST